MIQLHAPDPMGKAAHKAALLISRLDLHLLAASSTTCTREQRAESLHTFFKAWPKLVRAIADLEASAPNAAREGYDADAKLRDFIEARAVTP